MYGIKDKGRNQTPKEYRKDISKILKGIDDDIHRQVVGLILSNSKVTEIVTDLFDNDEDMKFYMTKEAITGKQKFGSSDAVCDHIMVFNPSTKNIKMVALTDKVIESYSVPARYSLTFSTKKKRKKTGVFCVPM